MTTFLALFGGFAVLAAFVNFVPIWMDRSVLYLVGIVLIVGAAICVRLEELADR